MDFIDRAAHVDPGMRYSSSSRRKYQKIVTNVIFANQLIAGGVFDDEDQVECTHTIYIIFLSIFGCIIFLLFMVVVSLRFTCFELEDKLRRRSAVPMREISWVAMPVTANSVGVQGQRNMIPPILEVEEEDDDVLGESADYAADAAVSDALAPEADFPPAYGSLSPVHVIEDGATEEMGGAMAPNESSVEVSRPYPLMLPNNVGRDGPVVVCDDHTD